MCDKMTTQVVPRGYDYVEYPIRCGSTGYYGNQVICEECQAKGVQPKEHDFYDAGEYFSEEDY